MSRLLARVLACLLGPFLPGSCCHLSWWQELLSQGDAAQDHAQAQLAAGIVTITRKVTFGFAGSQTLNLGCSQCTDLAMS